MELALYAPGSGFYERRRTIIGKRGDFFTSVSVGSLFGKLLACQFVSWIKALGSGPAQLVEGGAGNGDLAADVLSWVHGQSPRPTWVSEYWIQEPSRRQRQLQQKRLAGFGRNVRWASGFDQLPAAGIEGVTFANELLDALPVRRLGWDAAARCWFEWGVAMAGDGFRWVRMDNPALPPDMNPLKGMPEEIGCALPDGFATEICPAAVDWWRRAARSLRRGWLVTLDYGFEAAEFLHPSRALGTLRGYRAHRSIDNVLADPGLQDLTAHVNFSAIRAAGEQEGLRTESLTTQGEFLTAIAGRWQEDRAGLDWTAEERRQFLTLVHPEHLGRRFRVLVQSRL